MISCVFDDAKLALRVWFFFARFTTSSSRGMEENAMTVATNQTLAGYDGIGRSWGFRQYQLYYM